MKENFPNLVKEIDVQVEEVQRVPNKMDGCKEYQTKMPKVKERILKAAREMQIITSKGVS